MLLISSTMSCNTPRKVSGKEFQLIYETRGQNTMSHAEYLGHRDDKVYIVKKTMSLIKQKKWNEESIYTNIADLNPSFRKELLEDSFELNKCRIPGTRTELGKKMKDGVKMIAKTDQSNYSRNATSCYSKGKSRAKGFFL